MRHVVIIFACILTFALVSPGVAAATTLYTNYTAQSDSLNAFGLGGFAVSDSFTLTSASNLTDVTFDSWVNSALGNFPVFTEEIDLGTAAFGSDVFSLAAGAPRTATEFLVVTVSNAGGLFDVFRETEFFPSPLALAPGTYWLTLSHGGTHLGGGELWDESNGSSVAFQNPGSISRPSESFLLDGTRSSTAVPEPATLTLTALGFAGAMTRYRRRRASR